MPRVAPHHVAVIAVGALALALVTRPALGADGGGDDELTLELPGAPLVLRRIPKGRFTQGSPAGEAGREADEASRPVALTRDVWMGRTEITRGQFAAFVADAHYLTEAETGASGGHGWDGKALVQKKEFTWRTPGFPQTDDHPVVLVTWGDANAYAAWATRKTGRRVRLPTEAEWEYAARAGTSTPWYAGATKPDALTAGWLEPNASGGTRPVAQRPANAFGLHDMIGNAFEWCRDVYAPYGKTAVTDPEQTSAVGTEPERRVLRGGSWMRDAKKGRSGARHRATPGTRNAENGFRVVVTNEESLAPGTLGHSPGGFATASPLALGSATPDGTAADAGGGAQVGEEDPTRSSSGEGLGWALLAAPAAAAGAVAAWLLARRRGTPAGSAGFATRAADDGFFVRAPSDARGARVRYDCVVNETVVSDVVPLDGGEETFVYTGGRPSAIRILEVIRVASGGYRAADVGAARASSSASTRPGPPPARGATAKEPTAEKVDRAPGPQPSSPELDPLVVPLVVHQTMAAQTTSPSAATSPTRDDEPFLGTPRAY